MAAKGMLDSTSLPWLTAVLDPYHDTEIDGKISWPDANNAASITRVVKLSRDFIKPATVSGNWDLIVSSTPMLNKKIMSRSKTYPFRQNDHLVIWNGTTSGVDDSNIGELGFLNCASFNSSTVTDYGYLASQFEETHAFILPDSFSTGKGRLLAAGFEVHNVTPELYRSGTVTVGRYPQPSNRNFTFCQEHQQINATSPPVQTSYFSINSSRHVVDRPPTVSAAMLLSGSRQWEATKGSYNVVPFNDINNPDREPDWIQPFIDNNAMSLQVGNFASQQSKIGFVHQEPLSNPGGVGPNKWAPVDSSFAYYTGLSPETVLRVNVLLYYETFPGTLEDDLITLAKPSIDYDPLALAFYKHAVTQLPPGVPVNMNGLGDWFAMVVSEYADLAGAGLSALGVPGAGLAAAGAKRLADAHIKSRAAEKPQGTVAQYASKQKKEKQRQKQGGVASPNMKK